MSNHLDIMYGRAKRKTSWKAFVLMPFKLLIVFNQNLVWFLTILIYLYLNVFILLLFWHWVWYSCFFIWHKNTLWAHCQMYFEWVYSSISKQGSCLLEGNKHPTCSWFYIFCFFMDIKWSEKMALLHLFVSILMEVKMRYPF